MAAASRRRGSMLRSTGVIVRTTNGIATSAWAIGHEPRATSQVERRLVERDEEPEADGDGRDAEREQTARCRATARPSARSGRERPPPPPTTTASTVATAANCSEFATASMGGTKSVLPWPTLVERAVDVEPVAVAGPEATARPARASGTPSSTAMTARLPATSARSAASAGRRAVSPAARSARAWVVPALSRRVDDEERDHRDELHDASSAGRDRQVEELQPSGGRSRSRASTRVGPPRIRITPNDVKVKRNTMPLAATIAGRSAGSVTHGRRATDCAPASVRLPPGADRGAPRGPRPCARPRRS